jgi:hypothetical protein
MTDKKKTGVKDEEVTAKKETTDDLNDKLKKINGRKNVLGYISRTPKTATIDLKDPTKVINYAVLSYSSYEACERLSEIFKLGDFEKVIVKGKIVNMLSFNINKNRISIFTDKDEDLEEILKIKA